MNNETAQATEIINNASDTQMGGTGIGQSSPTINLNANNNNQTPTPKKEYTQGQHSQNIEKWQKEIDKLNEYLEDKQYGFGSYILDKYKSKELEEFLTNHLHSKYTKETAHEFDPEKDWREGVDQYIATLKDQIYDTKNKTNYDNRTDEQIREDKSVQRAVEDALKAGINPAALNYGATAGGGGGGGSSSKEEEEERKRKKRAREEAERRRKELLMQNVMRTLQMIGYTTGRVGGYAMLGHVRSGGYQKAQAAKTATQPIKAATTTAQPKNINNTTTAADRMKAKISKNDWLNEYLDELKDMKPENR